MDPIAWLTRISTAVTRETLPQILRQIADTLDAQTAGQPPVVVHIAQVVVQAPPKRFGR
ncbi:hypothetical protein [Rhodococcus sp. NPDC127528]|uniref:hypothetical protein n=1 Tax=unclassified Rhodococcus (in: high G+C Gram-positive bacteria) TaxID=192944 RepID=UPI003643FFF6